MGKPSSLIEYEEYTEEDAEADAEEQQAARGGGAFLKLQDGKTRVRFIPAPKGSRWKVPVMEHFYESPGIGKVKHVCVKHSTKGKRPCPSCRAEARLRKSDSAVDETRANDMRAKRRCYTKVMLRDKDGGDECKLFAFGPQIEGELTDLRNGGYDFLHPMKGCDVIIIRRTVNKRTNYKVVAAEKGAPTKLAKTTAEINELIEGVEELAKFARVPSEEDLEAILAGEKPERSERGSANRGGSRGRTAVDDADDEEDEDEEDDDGDYEDEDEEEIPY